MTSGHDFQYKATESTSLHNSSPFERELDAQHTTKQSIKEIPLRFKSKAASPVNPSTGAVLHTTLIGREQPPRAARERRRQVASTASYQSGFSKYAANSFHVTALKMTAEKYLSCAAGTKVPRQVSGKHKQQ